MILATPSRSSLSGLSSGFAAAGGSSLATAGVAAGVALAAQGISLWVQSARLRGGQKLQATNVANEIERKLKDLKKAYEASPKSLADWQYAKQAENQLFDLLASGCGTMELGSAGQRCVEERLCTEDEGCKYPWKTWYSIGPAPEGAVLGADGLTVVGSTSPSTNPPGVSSNPFTQFLAPKGAAGSDGASAPSSVALLVGLGVVGLGLVMAFGD